MIRQTANGRTHLLHASPSVKNSPSHPIHAYQQPVYPEPQSGTEQAAYQHTCYRHSQRSLSTHPTLTLVAGMVRHRHPRYVQAFQQGKARWYHMPVSTSQRQQISAVMMSAIRYCAIAMPCADMRVQKIQTVYPVISIRLVPRDQLTAEQTGSYKENAPTEKQYWLFELGEPQHLPHAIIKPNTTDFSFKLTDYTALQRNTTWQHLPPAPLAQSVNLTEIHR
ncbi:MAG: hypothetical protein ACRDDD_09580 [Plesiomonas sp.]|uniref:hypothetical protein n=1 Tax=Plesiomonas sp. TaxID=2486279 RepID=UPI003EE7785D